jgi:tRNA A37 threonylcarbamoyltransferase TsaD
MMNDNAAMIAWATILKYSKISNINFRASARLTVD